MICGTVSLPLPPRARECATTSHLRGHLLDCSLILHWIVQPHSAPMKQGLFRSHQPFRSRFGLLLRSEAIFINGNSRSTFHFVPHDGEQKR